MSHVIGSVVAVDLGGTKTTAALVTPTGAISARHTVPTPAAAGPSAVLDAVAEVVDHVSTEATAPVRKVGVGSAGLVDVDTGTIVSATNAMPGWAGTALGAELVARLRSRWGHSVRVHVQNDVDAHATGEAWKGAARGRSCVLMVTVGTGVGASLVLDGKPRYGAHWGAGEIGHVPTPRAEGLRCACGRLGHLEAVAAGTAVARRYQASTGIVADGEQVVALSLRGDVTATRMVTDAAVALGQAIAGQVTVLDPDIVVIGGGFANAGPLWWAAMDDTVRSELVPVLQAVEIVPTSLGADAALLGAARAAQDLLSQDAEPGTARRPSAPPRPTSAASAGQSSPRDGIHDHDSENRPS